jgi:C-terminal processing protease CtpA/Prc
MAKPSRTFSSPPIVFHSLFVGIVFCLMSCSGSRNAYNPETKYAPAQLLEDFDIGWQTYQKNHPSYDWYTPADSVDARFARARASITDSLTEPEFRLRLAYAVSAIRCGHTSVISSKAYQRYAKKLKEPQFPLAMKVWGTDSMVVIANLVSDSVAVKRGDIVISIDSIPPSVIIRQMKDYVSTDGFSDGFRDMSISGNFPGRFKWLYGVPKTFELTYLDSGRALKTTKVPAFTLPTKQALDSSIEKVLAKIPPVQGRKKPPSSYGDFSIDTLHNLGILNLNTFSHRKVPSLIRKTFKESQNAGLKNLAIDLRTNGGGKIDNSTLLTRYIADKPFRVADSVSAKDLRLAHPKHTQMAWVYRYFRWTFSSKKEDGRWHMQPAERHTYNPKKRHHYDGQVYVLTSGATFSASTLFLAKVFQQTNVTVVGDETGGGARGNSAVLVPKLTLPNTRVQLRLPLFRLITDAQLPQDGRGIMPDVPVQVDSYYIQQGVDKKMEAVKLLIAEKLKS